MKFSKKTLPSGVGVPIPFILLFFSIVLSNCSNYSLSIKESNSKVYAGDKVISQPDIDSFKTIPCETQLPKNTGTKSLTKSSLIIASWNLEDFGKSKHEPVINFVAGVVKSFDIIAIQEVVAGFGGAQAVAKLAAELNRTGSKWDYKISPPTSGENSYKRERYAFIWKTSRVSLHGNPWLEIQYTNEINREPFFATFQFKNKLFTLVNFHAITKKMQPETEIKYFKFLPTEYPDKNLIFSGDFNCPESHTVFNPLKKMGYQPIFSKQKTSLKMEAVNNEYLASEFDNIFYNTGKIKFINSGVIHFYKCFTSLNEARSVSDHIPIWFEFSLN